MKAIVVLNILMTNLCFSAFFISKVSYKKMQVLNALSHIQNYGTTRRIASQPLNERGYEFFITLYYYVQSELKFWIHFRK